MKDLIDIRGDGCESCGDDVQDYNINHGYENNPGPKEAADRKLRRGLSYGLGISLPVFVVLSGLLLGYQCYYKPRHQSKKDAKIAAAAAKEEEWVADHDPVTGERMLPLN